MSDNNNAGRLARIKTPFIEPGETGYYIRTMDFETGKWVNVDLAALDLPQREHFVNSLLDDPDKMAAWLGACLTSLAGFATANEALVSALEIFSRDAKNLQNIADEVLAIWKGADDDKA